MHKQTLVIVESPGKIKKIRALLGDAYRVAACVGHICDLSPTELSIEIRGDDSFVPKYVTLPGKSRILKHLRSELAACQGRVILATDQDREGEFIAHSLRNTLKLGDPPRILFNEITRGALLAALDRPGKIRDALVDAQKARRVLDRLVGYLISPLMGKGRSAGRVQSVVIRMIAEQGQVVTDAIAAARSSRESVLGVVVTGTFVGTSQFIENAVMMVEATLELHTILRTLLVDERHFTVTDVREYESSRSPPPPYKTSTLQQDASHRLRLSADATMRLAQSLYEKGHITYMRTDSTAMCLEAVEAYREYIEAKFGQEYVSTSAGARAGAAGGDAHEAIRPTMVTAEEIDSLTPNEEKLYRLIYYRALASQMSPALTQVQRIELHRDAVIFISEVKHITFDGFTRCLGSVPTSSSPPPAIPTTTSIRPGDLFTLTNATAKEQLKAFPTRYDEASLVKKMESLRIGRPSTYASILQMICDRGYVTKEESYGLDFVLHSVSADRGFVNVKTMMKSTTVGAEKQRYHVTPVGTEVIAFLQARFPQIMDYEFTAQMEHSLDQVACREVYWQQVLAQFYQAVILSSTTTIPAPGSTSLGEDPATGRRFVYVADGKYGMTLRIEHPTGDGTFVTSYTTVNEPIRDLEEAVRAASNTRFLGLYRKTPLFVIQGPYGYYLRHGKKRIGVKKHGDISFEMAKKLI